jgi:hypothetical protein
MYIRQTGLELNDVSGNLVSGADELEAVSYFGTIMNMTVLC